MPDDENERSRIEDIEKIQKLRETIDSLKVMRMSIPHLERLFGMKFDTDELNRLFDDLGFEALEKESLRIISHPDRFDSIFGNRGWIVYDFMDPDIVERAIEKGEAGDIEGAEDDLVAYYSPKVIFRNLFYMDGIKAFRPRARLAKLALRDYEDGRYHACIPVLLTLMDGLVNDLYRDHHGNRKGISAEGVRLEAWNSISAHTQGLGKIVNTVFRRKNSKTKSEPIDTPFRNGIMHGTLLGYDNLMVAAKAWGILFSLHEWAVKAERDELKPPTLNPAPTVDDVVKNLEKTVQLIRERATEETLRKAWEPRTIVLGDNVPVTGEESGFGEGEPEHAVARFLNYWKKGNYKGMTRDAHFDALDKKYIPVKEMPLKLKNRFGEKALQRFELTEIVDDMYCASDIHVTLWYVENGEEREKSVRYRLINYDENDVPVVRGKPGSRWYISNWRWTFQR